mmetsp:Transcript_8302/g.7353  ORF Transcript_8302/g.7353 Transcript_8302/m.7353 type:complete len:181 (-) Transcript_8302:60-602(-)
MTKIPTIGLRRAESDSDQSFSGAITAFKRHKRRAVRMQTMMGNNLSISKKNLNRSSTVSNKKTPSVVAGVSESRANTSRTNLNTKETVTETSSENESSITKRRMKNELKKTDLFIKNIQQRKSIKEQRKEVSKLYSGTLTGNKAGFSQIEIHSQEIAKEFGEIPNLDESMFSLNSFLLKY